MQFLDQLEGFSWRDGLAPGGFFAGGEIGFKSRAGFGEAAAQNGGEVGRGHLLAAQTA